nr:zinc finger, CCHC-type [Tanacetum cinerariifolium]
TLLANNSVFRVFFEKQKLTGPNFIDWYRQLRIVQLIEDKLNYLEQPIPPALVVPTAQHVTPEILTAHTAWNKGSKEIAGLMLMTEEGQSVSSYVLKMKGYIDNLEHLGYPVTLGLGVSLILIGLRKEFDGFVQNYNMHSLRKTINELHVMLKLHEQTLTKNNAPALHAIRAGKVHKGLGASRKLKPRALSLYVGNGQHEAVEAIGVFYLCLPSELEPIPPALVVHAAQHVTPEILTAHTAWIKGSKEIDGLMLMTVKPDIQRNLETLHAHEKLLELKTLFAQQAEHELLQTTRDFYSCKQEEGQTLEEELSSVLRRVAKVEKERSFGSWWFRTFEKCVSCMFGKMARKPYTHQVEKAKDLLGLIHTDVCGPFKIMSRQGASYFITFTDDLSRYGYVYLLKHKHKVFETFKVFQKEVENQLGKTIKSLRSDHGENSLITQEASGSLEDLEIIQEENTHPSINTSLNHEDDDLEIDKPQIELPPNGKIIGSKWLFKKKINMDRVVHTYKARLVAKGYTQTTGIDYEETFSPVADIRAIRILIAIAAYYDYEIWQMDVKLVSSMDILMKRFTWSNLKVLSVQNIQTGYAS